MKKTRIVCMLVAVMFVLSSLAVFADYDPNAYLYPETNEVGQIIAKNNTPTIDANISDGEGWSDMKTLDYTNMPVFWGPDSRCIITANVRFAWDTTNLYLAADVADATMVYSSAEEEPNEYGVVEYGYTGDVLVFGIDPLAACLNAGMSANGQRTAWYCFAIGEGNVFKAYRSNSEGSDGDIVDKVQGAVTSTSTGWALEVALPWEMILEDTFTVSFGDVDLTVDEVTVAGAISNAGIMYMDRAIATPELAVFNSGSDAVAEGELFTIGRSITVPLVHADGMKWSDGGESLRSYGIGLTIGDAAGVAPETTVAETTEEVTEAVTTEADEEEPKEEAEETKADAEESEALDETAATEEEGGAPVGLIIGIVAAIVVVAAVGVVIVIKKMKK